MTRFQTCSVLLLATALALAGCKKKDDTSAASSAKPIETAPTKPAEPAATPAAPAPAPGGSALLASDEDYIAKAIVNLDKLTEIFKSNSSDCDKLADGITKLQSDNAAMFAALKAYEAAHPEAKKKFDEAAKGRYAAFEAAAGPVMTTCQNNSRVGDALTKLAN